MQALLLQFISHNDIDGVAQCLAVGAQPSLPGPTKRTALHEAACRVSHTHQPARLPVYMAGHVLHESAAFVTDCCCEQSRAEIVELLCRQPSVLVNAQDYFSATALHYAAHNGSARSVQGKLMRRRGCLGYAPRL